MSGWHAAHPDAASALVVVGASLAGLRAVEAARRDGYTGSITLLGAEAHLPYDRPPLSKSFLSADGAPTFYRTETELGDLDVDLRLGDPATALDTDSQTVHTKNGHTVPYSQLIVATGSSPRRLEHLRDLDGVVTLRTLDDATGLRGRLGRTTKVVIVGAGFIGSEIASSLAARGAQVTILEAAPVPLVRAVGDIVGAAISDLHRRNGTRLLCNVQIDELLGDDHVTGIVLTDGEVIEADAVVVGVGSAPATSWLASSGIELDPRDRGVVCDQYLESSVPRVYAAGDVAHWPNALLNETMRLENWTNASGQAAHAARNALFPDRREPYVTVPYFWTDWYQHRIQFVGTARADEVTFVSGTPDGDHFVALYRRGDRLVGAATLNEPRQIMKFRRMIGEQATWASALEFATPPVLTGNGR